MLGRRRFVSLLLICAVLAAPVVHGASMRELIDDAKADFEKKDYAAAIKLLVPLAQDGNVEAQYYLGQCFEHGYGTRKDVVAAISWYEYAANSNHAESQVRIGYIYMNGIGVFVDVLKAYMWFEIALINHRSWENRATAVYYRNVARHKMTTAQQVEAEQAARNWKSGTLGRN
ncbi:putative Sel1 repeat family protein [Azospirillaceae bacterium]